MGTRDSEQTKRDMSEDQKNPMTSMAPSAPVGPDAYYVQGVAVPQQPVYYAHGGSGPEHYTLGIPQQQQQQPALEDKTGEEYELRQALTRASIPISAILLVCSIVACYDWWVITLKTKSGSCDDDDDNCDQGDASCDLSIYIYMNQGACFGVKAIDTKCFNWHDDYWNTIAEVTNTDVDREARDLFWPTYTVSIGWSVALSFLFLMMSFGALCRRACRCWNGTEVHGQYRYLFITCLTMMAICACNIAALTSIGSSRNSHDVMNPSTWMDFVDTGRNFGSSVDCSHSDDYVWDAAKVRVSSAFNACVVNAVVSGFGVCVFMLFYSGFRLKGFK